MPGQGDVERARRISVNEALFRRVNEQIQGLTRWFEAPGDDLSAVCECGYAECHQRVQVPVTVYERARADASQFIVIPGHEIEEVEDVLETAESFSIVAKRAGVPRQVAEQTDPRAT